MKNILVFVAHPKAKGSANILANAFEEGVDKKSFKIESIDLFKKQLPVYAMQDEKNISPEIKKINEKWHNADVIAFFMPNWWGIAPTPVADVISWNGFEIADFKGKMPQSKMKGKKIIWVVTGAAPKIARKLFFKTDTEKWGKYIFGFSGAKFISKFYDGLGYGTGKVPEKYQEEVRQLAKNL